LLLRKKKFRAATGRFPLLLVMSAFRVVSYDSNLNASAAESRYLDQSLHTIATAGAGAMIIFKTLGGSSNSTQVSCTSWGSEEGRVNPSKGEIVTNSASYAKRSSVCATLPLLIMYTGIKMATRKKSWMSYAYATPGDQ
jgi:hypothetical protein